jgi:hypothetical protein
MGSMSGELLRRLLFNCSHQFSWPRQAEDGQHYQICVQCGTTYRYDWSRMRRVARVPNGSATVENLSRHKLKTRTCWTPRSRRLRYEVAVLLRANATDTWIEGTTENISASGILLRVPSDIAVGISVELRLEMPHEITGRMAALVLCKGSVVRTTAVPADRKNKAETFTVACRISGYTFIAGPQQIAI